jgi:transcriptional regulator with XRE-family HTH domain
MLISRRKSRAIKFLEEVAGGPLTFGSLVEALRLSEDMPQATFARRLGISKSHLCDIEKGRKTVSPERALHFAAVLGYPEEQFVRLALQDMLRKARIKLKVKVEAA